jgi:hypothetical protein
MPYSYKLAKKHLKPVEIERLAMCMLLLADTVKVRTQSIHISFADSKLLFRLIGLQPLRSLAVRREASVQCSALL